MSPGHEVSKGLPDAPEKDAEQELQQICDALKGLQFGTVTIIVQDGVIVQNDRTEKRRLRRVSKPESQSCSR